MNRKVLVIAVVLMAVAMLAVPVMAVPTQGQKVPITITWTRTGASGPPPTPTGHVLHRRFTVMWDVVLVIDGGPPLVGTATSERKLLRVFKGEEGKELRILNDYDVLTFPGGTFEGNALLQTDFDPAGGEYTYSRLCHALLQGTGDFEGQTINAEHDWRSHDLPVEWSGYLLKP